MQSAPFRSNPSQSLARQALMPLVLLCWLALAYTWLSARLQPEQIAPASILSAWLAPVLPIHGQLLCLFKSLTHLPCVFCGLTRSFILIGQGHWQESLHYHLLGIPAYLLTLATAVLGIAAPAQATRMIRFLTQRRALFTLIALLLLCWLWKLGHSQQFW